MSRKTANGVLAILLLGSTATLTVTAWAADSPGLVRSLSVKKPGAHALATSHVSVRPKHGPGGTQVRVAGYADHACTDVRITFTDSAGVTTQLTVTHAGSFDVATSIPLSAALGAGRVTATWLIPGIDGCTTSTAQVSTSFTVTALAAWGR